MVTTNLHAARHHAIGVGVPFVCLPPHNILETWLTKDISREDGARLNPAPLDEDLQIASLEWRFLAHDLRKRQPARVRRLKLARQDKPVAVFGKKFPVEREVAPARFHVCREAVNLDETKGRADFRRFE